MDGTQPQEAASLTSELKASRTRCSELEHELRKSQREASKLEVLRTRCTDLELLQRILPADLLSAMKGFPQELTQRMISADRAIMLAMVSKEVRAAIEHVRPAARAKAKPMLEIDWVKAKPKQDIDEVEGGLRTIARFCLITVLDLSPLRIGREGVGRLVAVLGHVPVACPPLP
jgi:hypothetical protein